MSARFLLTSGRQLWRSPAILPRPAPLRSPLRFLSDSRSSQQSPKPTSDAAASTEPSNGTANDPAAANAPPSESSAAESTPAPPFKRAQSIYDLDPLLIRPHTEAPADAAPTSTETTPATAAEAADQANAEAGHPTTTSTSATGTDSAAPVEGAPQGSADGPPLPPSGLNRRRRGAGGHRGKPTSSEGKGRSGPILIATALLAAGTIGFMSRPLDAAEEEQLRSKKPKDSGDDSIDQVAQLAAPGAFWPRFKYRLGESMGYFSRPAWDNLLPDPLPEPYQRPYTLLINLDETLVHTSWDVDHGWRTAKRPGVDYFLGYLSKFYEIVLFTTQPSYAAMPIIEKLDPYGYIMYHLYRESTRYEDGVYLKDITKLNRDPAKVVALDSNPAAYARQPRNLVALKPWKGDPEDTYLTDIMPFLEYLAMSDVPDVRGVLDYYQGKDVAREFNAWEKDLQHRLRERWEEDRARKAQGLSGWLSAVAGGSTGEEPPLPLFVQHRQAMRQAYEEELETVKQQAEAERARMMEEQTQQLKDMKLTMWKIIQEGGIPQPPNPNAGPEAGGDRKE
ncbi:mitochondrial inner membrane protein required for protein import [Tieghemiomyces parasiticus]|uniref:Mitochondrial import inner membrane translocase subunit TIM50 n=1 Tax=Tieghemiomyces parasiticus TaxID=78921 RepID=A0A9W8AEJ6_9FUNG|nr:mitochondrial inner membrane protein required for protein import [Tieghemiomyces parasiticus]